MTTGLHDDAADSVEKAASTPGDNGSGNVSGTADVAAPLGTPQAKVPRRRRRGRLTLQSKLLAMLLPASILSTLVAGYIGYRSGTDALEEAAFDRMTAVREARTREVTQLFDRIRNLLVVFTRGTTIGDALRGFESGFDELQDSTLTPAQDAALQDYYANQFVPDLNARSDGAVAPEGFLPDNPAQAYLQAHYTAPFADFDEAAAKNDAGDGSAWSAAHATFHEYFREATTRFAFEDAFLLDTEGNVLYSVYKGVDLGTNILTGPYAGGAFQDTFTTAMRSNSFDFVAMSDFDRYQPSLNRPTAFAISPIADGGEIIGAFGVELPIDTINSVMTGDQEWVADGLGDTGEVYLVGRDNLMRSVSRLLLEEPDHFEEDVVEGGTSPETAAFMVQVGGSILLQEITNRAANEALQGQSGTTIVEDYRGHEVLAAYAPLPDDDLNWGVVAQIDTDEAFEPVRDLARNLGLAIAAIVLLVSVAALLMARILARPVQRLLDGVRRIAAGELGVQVPPSTTEEYDDLSTAFNEMSTSLHTKAELIEEQQRENDRMLLTMMPEPVARRYRGGEETIAEDHANVSVVFADIVGFDEFAGDLSSDQSLALLNGLVRGFDEAAERTGVERVRTIRRGYLASCGLVTPRIDHVRRAVDFAQEMQGIIDRFNAQHGSQLGLRAGVDAGTVTSGLIGRSSVVYDMWGDAVNLAYRVQGAGGQTGVFVTSRVYDRLRDSGYTFDQAGTVDTQAGSQPVWLLQPRSARGS